VVSQIRTVFASSFFDVILKNAALKDSGVFSKQTKQQAHQVKFELVTIVTDFLQLIVKPAHVFGGFDIDRIFLAGFMFLVAGDKAEQMNVFVKFLQIKLMLLFFFKVVEPEAGKVRYQNILRQVAFLDARK